MNKLKVGLLLVGGTVVLVMLSMVCVTSLPILREEVPEVVSKGMLLPGMSSGKQTITDSLEQHLYEFSGEANQTIEIRIHPFSDVYMMGMVRANGYKNELAMAFGDIEGELGDDLTMTVSLPETGVYQIFVDMVDPYVGDYEVQVNILLE